MEPLALKHRPRTFDDLVGQRVVHVVLRQMVVKQKVPTALLFDGTRGTGKTTTLRILAAALNCDTPPGPCGHCPGCTAVFAGTSPNLREIDAASHGLVDDIRALRQQMLYAVSDGWRVIGLDEAHSMSAQAFNALLKMLEEPPPNTVFVLLTTDPGRIPDTVLSRAMRFTFRRIPVADIAARLDHICAAENINVEPALRHLIAERADGGLRDAVMLLDQVTGVGVTTAEQLTELLGDTDPGPALLDVIRTGDLAAAFTTVAEHLTRIADPGALVAALTATLRDICILRAGGDLSSQGGALDARRRLADAVDGPTAMAALRVLWDLQTRIPASADPRTGVELAVAMLVDVFAPTPTPAAATAPARRLSLADMAALAR